MKTGDNNIINRITEFHKHILWVMVFVFVGCLSFETLAQGDLLITPNRVIFEGRKKKEQLNLINIGKEVATYSVSFVQRRMNQDGGFEAITVPDSGQMFADPYLRIYPRQVSLQPGEAQVIMLQVRQEPDMKDGEYRSHLYFRSEKEYKPLGQEKTSNDSTALNVQLIPIFGMSIPIIIRIGDINAEASLSNLKLETDSLGFTHLAFDLNRTGNISVYGNLLVDYVPDKGKPYQVGAIKGVAVYTNLNRRYVKIKLNDTEDILSKKGKLRLRYTSRDETKKQEVYAESELELK